MGHSLPLLMSTAEAFCLFFTVLKLMLLLLLNSATQKLLVIKPHLWPWIKILSSKGHKSDAFHHKLCTLSTHMLNCLPPQLQCRRPSSIPGSGRSPGEGYGNPLQYSCLENPCGKRSPSGYSPWSSEDSDMTE